MSPRVYKFSSTEKETNQERQFSLKKESFWESRKFVFLVFAATIILSLLCWLKGELQGDFQTWWGSEKMTFEKEK
jgi:hypothetical protein